MVVVPSAEYPKGLGLIPGLDTFFFSQNFFVMDKERTMRARSYGAQPPVIAPEARSYGTRPFLHDRAGTFASLPYKAEKPSVCLSVCPSRLYLTISA